MDWIPQPVFMTVDLVVLTVRSNAFQVLVIERGVPPHEGERALPGGFMILGETLEEAARRELREETGLDVPLPLEQVRCYSAVDRDSRGRVVTLSFLAISPDLPTPTGGSDAASADYVDVESVLVEGALAFDHGTILRDAVAQARLKLHYTTIATAFCGAEFTISELHAVYETILGISLDRPNFSRKVVESQGFVEPTGRTRTTLGRPARLYRAGRATLLTRPLTAWLQLP